MADPGPVVQAVPSTPTVNPSNGIEISGVADPGVTVRLVGPGINASAPVDSAGNWSYLVPGAPLADLTTVQVFALNDLGEESAAVALVIDRAAPAPPVIDPSDGTIITGTAEALGTVQLALGPISSPWAQFADVPVDGAGNWSYTPVTPFAVGDVILARARDALGNPSNHSEMTVREPSHYTVTDLTQLNSALAVCASAPLRITLGADIVSTATELTIGCDTTLDLATHDLSVRNIIISTGSTLEVTGPTDGNEGTLTVDATGVSAIAAIQNTASMLRVTGGEVVASSGLHGAAIGGAIDQDAGALQVDGGQVRAIGNASYAATIGGGTSGGNGGTIVVTGGEVHAQSNANYATVIGGGAGWEPIDGGDGATITVTGGALTAQAEGTRSIAIGGGEVEGPSGAPGLSRSGDSGSLTIGPDGKVTAISSFNAFGAGHAWGARPSGGVGPVVVEGTLMLPSGELKLDDDVSHAEEILVEAGGEIIGDPANPTAGAQISGTGWIHNRGVIALHPPAAMVTGNNTLLTFDTGASPVRVFAPTAASGHRALPAPPDGTQWNREFDGLGEWFTDESDTSHFGSAVTVLLHAVVPGAIEISNDPDALSATAGSPFIHPVTVVDASGAPLVPQPTVTIAAPGCGFDGVNVFTLAGGCTVTASTTVLGVPLEASFDIEVQAAAADSLVLTPSATTVEQGGSLTFTVTGEDVYGNAADSSAAVLSSSVATDVVDGHTVTFPHASPHTITATLGAAVASVTIQVLPSPVAGEIASTGLGSDAGALAAAGALALLLGVASVIFVRRRIGSAA